MEYQHILVSVENGVATVTLNREKALNAINQTMMTELGQFFSHDAFQIEGLKGVIVAGSGVKAFAAGADIKEFSGLEGDGGGKLAQRGHNVFHAIERFPMPVVAAVQGWALGAGCELAMACHLRIASDNAKMGLPEATLGLIPGYGGTQRLAQLVGKGRALEMLMTTTPIDAQKALHWGLVNKVVAHADLMTETLSFMNTILSKSAPLALAKIVSCVTDVYTEGVNGFASEVREFNNLCQTEDFREGSAAFVEKRKANFKGA